MNIGDIVQATFISNGYSQEMVGGEKVSLTGQIIHVYTNEAHITSVVVGFKCWPLKGDTYDPLDLITYKDLESITTNITNSFYPTEKHLEENIQLYDKFIKCKKANTIFSYRFFDTTRLCEIEVLPPLNNYSIEEITNQLDKEIKIGSTYNPLRSSRKFLPDANIQLY